MSDTIHSCSPFCKLPTCVEHRQRRDFEAWCKVRGGISTFRDSTPHSNGGTNEYDNAWTNHAWWAWQAATESATQATDTKIAALRQKVSETELMAECTVMLRDDLIEAGIVDYFVPPMMLTEAILRHVAAIRQGGDT